MSAPYPPPIINLDFGSEPYSVVAKWVKDRFTILQDREPDPVEALEREAHFETKKAKGAKK
jgi:hypothetical protein